MAGIATTMLQHIAFSARNRLAAAALGLGAVLAAPATAAPVPQGLRAWLMAIEAVPTAEQLRRAGGTDLENRLHAVARDSAEPTYARHRALSLLAIAATPKSTEFLRKNLTIADAPLRATAALAWASGPARRGEAGGLIELDRLLGDPAPLVRTAAARGLEYAADPMAARARAVRRRGLEQSPEVLRAIDRAIQRIDERAAAGQ